jgi:hypothetical protein
MCLNIFMSTFNREEQSVQTQVHPGHSLQKGPAHDVSDLLVRFLLCLLGYSIRGTSGVGAMAPVSYHYCCHACGLLEKNRELGQREMLM